MNAPRGGRVQSYKTGPMETRSCLTLGYRKVSLNSLGYSELDELLKANVKNELLIGITLASHTQVTDTRNSYTYINR
jgi:hypothetical protein